MDRRNTYEKQKLYYKLAVFQILFLVFSGAITANAQANQPGYRLIGTIEGKEFSGAVVDDSTGKQTLYRLHERLPDGSQIIKVRSDSISVKGSDGISYDLFIVHGSKPSPVGANTSVQPQAVAEQHAAPALTQPAPVNNPTQKERMSRKRRHRPPSEE